jgi:hypothetical protein
MSVALAYILWHSPALVPVAVVIVALAVAAVLWLYPPQIRALGRAWRWGLPALRVLALAALAVAILKPVSVRPKSAEEQGAVVVLVDQSRSMGVVDAGRSPAELVALADGLGLLPAGAREPAAAGLDVDLDRIAALADELVRGRSEVDYAGLTGRGVDDARRRVAELVAALKSSVVAAASRAPAGTAADDLRTRLADVAAAPVASDEVAMNELRARLDRAGDALARFRSTADAALYEADPDVRRTCDELAGLSRAQLVARGLTSAAGGFLAGLPKGTPVHAFGFAGDVVPLPGLGGSGPAPAVITVEATGDRSDVTGAVRTALARVRGRPVQAVVLLSDGRQVGGDTGVAAATADGSAAPVFAVSAAGPLRKDVSVVRVSLPPSQFVDETAVVRADVRATGMKGARLDVSLEPSPGAGSDATGYDNAGGGDAPFEPQRQTVTIGDDETATVEFRVKFDQPGAHRVAVAAAPQADEASLENNRAERWIKVLSDRVPVAAYSGTAGWDFQYVRNALSRAPWVTLTHGVLHGRDQQPLLSPDELLQQGVVVLSDLAEENLGPAQWDAVYRLVTERGGSVILLAGDDRLPWAFGQSPLLANLLPWPAGVWPAWRVWPGESPAFRFVPAKEAADLPALRLTDAPAADAAARWHELPPLFRYLPLSDLKPNARPLLVERETGVPVLVESRLGLGRVLFLGTNETWRWRYKVGERDHDRFWLQLVRYASDEPYAAHDERLWLDADRVSVEPGEPVRVRAKVVGDDGLPSAAAQQTLTVLRDGAALSTVTLLPAGGEKTGRYEAAVSDLPPGEYALRLADAADPARHVSVPLHVAAASEPELVNVAGNDELLRRLAEPTGGQLLALAELASLPERLEQVRRQQTRLAEYNLWDSPYLFTFVLACLGAEWALRKRFGLA